MEKILLRVLCICFSALVWYCCCRPKRNSVTIQSQPTVVSAPIYSNAPGVYAIPLPTPRTHEVSHILPQPYSTAPSAPDEPTVATAPTYSSAPGVYAIPLTPPRPHQASHILPQPYSTAPSAPDGLFEKPTFIDSALVEQAHSEKCYDMPVCATPVTVGHTGVMQYSLPILNEAEQRLLEDIKCDLEDMLNLGRCHAVGDEYFFYPAKILGY